MWAYARLGSVPREDAVRHADRVLAAAPPYHGAHELARSVYEQRKWDGGEGLVPISDYRIELAYRLTAPVSPGVLVHYYASRLPSWKLTIELADCKTIGLAPGCGALTASFEGAKRTLVINAVEYMRRPHLLSAYGVYVSQ